MDSNRSEIGELLDRRTGAMRTKDLEGLMSLYADDIVYFDLVPPLQYTGAAALRTRFSAWFDGWTGSIGMELRDVSISTGGDVAAAFMLLRASGTRTGGVEVGYWVRVTNGFRRSMDRWLITHEHVSLPVDLERGSPVMDLVP
jgi:ketosteroid isomerase-like protein